MNKKSLLISILLVWSLGPFLWQLYTSFSTPEALVNPFRELETRWTLNNYIQVLTSNPPFWRYLANSTLLGIATTFITLLFAIPAGYGLCKASKLINKLSRLILIATALFPYVLLFLALLEVARTLNLGNNLLALSIPYAALSMPLAVLLISSAIKDLPNDLEDAARLEGLSFIQRLRLILIPLITPATASTSILIFLFSWNEYPIALTWISRNELITLPVAMARIAGSSIYSVPYGAYAAATVLGSIPLLSIMLIFQRQIVSGLTQGAVK
ncbi:MAG: carbohydrate ABC transporter permease [Trichodesmium sp. MAG_R04]|nr:carbohydrate ABC transporter permease [Trichodesmium sp. MAG_R04]